MGILGCLYRGFCSDDNIIMAKEKQKIHKDVLITGILAITAIEITALSLGFDGVMLTTVIALIAGAIGISLPQLKFK